MVQHSIDVLRFELCGLGDPLHEGDIARVPSKVLHDLTGLRPKTPPHGLFELTILATDLMVMVALASMVVMMMVMVMVMVMVAVIMCF